ncbi:MAG: 7-cyano-7-deazaguanine synthase QueC [Zymomonas mobilis subsp. pomaceae]|uniref:7-cyano-7-deazaguanine synthase n=1 Tax=Zymomonas mobilis subsp. pomaceae (strain ATCC 29192 / DSM 22645 / JCM 10191 / CCUG 17912 / NBRC 13757 / NCIMB 11200 / NRRL B-4491 / Barker I) TaxID=579138 RepID=F8EU78_ZYMMT|nr:7-cyano-7-deazaguanine synthase QueC [Zymomonas mobilis]AEI37158.1 exsB protein [Zymomonas mobilis subsp. pomaceae ATCC 29192]MDX5948528.1 7-cyano-7-deazaguanine synthase QueC [Zymomonas mobilis subsp. pomaceae]GEB89836.1 7-cyano-7-deazaguanine synthase [Zymomonas mobilis subsp. pomaceae]
MTAIKKSFSSDIQYGTAQEGCLVLYSGGQDSTTCLAWALEHFSRVETIGFDYGQRHKVELDCRKTIRNELSKMSSTWADRLGQDHSLDLNVLHQISDCALTRETEIAFGEDGIPNSFVPGRNLLFFTFAATIAYRRGLRHIVGGMCETDYSGYPDCRDDTIKALQVAINLGLERRLVLHTPLMWLDKAATWQMAEEIGGAALVELIRQESHSCYLGDRQQLHPWGYGCGQCPACELRASGWEKYIENKSQ